MSAGDGASQREPEAEAAPLSRVHAAPPGVEFVEHPGELARLDPDAAVGDVDRHRPGLAPRVYLDLPHRVAVLDRVAEQVQHHLRDRVLVGEHRGEALVDEQREPEPVGFGMGAERRDDALQQLARVAGLEPVAAGAVLEPREIEHVLDQPSEPVALAPDDLEVVGGLAPPALARGPLGVLELHFEQLGEHPDRGERRAQLVRHVRDERGLGARQVGLAPRAPNEQHRSRQDREQQERDQPQPQGGGEIEALQRPGHVVGDHRHLPEVEGLGERLECGLAHAGARVPVGSVALALVAHDGEPGRAPGLQVGDDPTEELPFEAAEVDLGGQHPLDVDAGGVGERAIDQQEGLALRMLGEVAQPRRPVPVVQRDLVELGLEELDEVALADALLALLLEGPELVPPARRVRQGRGAQHAFRHGLDEIHVVRVLEGLDGVAAPDEIAAETGQRLQRVMLAAHALEGHRDLVLRQEAQVHAMEISRFGIAQEQVAVGGERLGPLGVLELGAAQVTLRDRPELLAMDLHQQRPVGLRRPLQIVIVVLEILAPGHHALEDLAVPALHLAPRLGRARLAAGGVGRIGDHSRLVDQVVAGDQRFPPVVPREPGRRGPRGGRGGAVERRLPARLDPLELDVDLVGRKPSVPPVALAQANFGIRALALDRAPAQQAEDAARQHDEAEQDEPDPDLAAPAPERGEDPARLAIARETFGGRERSRRRAHARTSPSPSRRTRSARREAGRRLRSARLSIRRSFRSGSRRGRVAYLRACLATSSAARYQRSASGSSAHRATAR